MGHFVPKVADIEQYRNYVYFIKLKKSYMKIKIENFIYDFFAFIKKKKINMKLNIKSSQEKTNEVILFDREVM